MSWEALAAVIRAAMEEVKKANPWSKDPFGHCGCAVCRRLRALYA